MGAAFAARANDPASRSSTPHGQATTSTKSTGIDSCSLFFLFSSCYLWPVRERRARRKSAWNAPASSVYAVSMRTRKLLNAGVRDAGSARRGTRTFASG